MSFTPSEDKYLESQGISPSAGGSLPAGMTTDYGSQIVGQSGIPGIPAGMDPAYGPQGAVQPGMGSVPNTSYQNQVISSNSGNINHSQDSGKRGLCDTYLLAVGLGFLGAHHFYLKRYGFGILYFFTFGLFGVGYVVDWFRVPYLVKEYNRKLENPTAPAQKSLGDAYLLWFPGGLFGFHHFYLERYVWGVLYLFTLGLFGIGWIVDGVRMHWLVKDANNKLRSAEPPKHVHKSLGIAYVFTIFPLTGVLGFQHYYLGRYIQGLYYTLTVGGFGIGWLLDWCRMPILVKRQNEKLPDPALHDQYAFLDDAYIYCFPLGFLGLHHFYLKRYGWGILYFFTIGLFGIGWLVDWFRLPCLVSDYNKSLQFNSNQSNNPTGVHVGPIVTIIPNNGPPVTSAQYPGYPGYQTVGMPGIYPQPGPGIYPSAGQDSWTTVTSSNVSDQPGDQPPSYAETVSGPASQLPPIDANSEATAPPQYFDKQ